MTDKTVVHGEIHSFCDRQQTDRDTPNTLKDPHHHSPPLHCMGTSVMSLPSIFSRVFTWLAAFKQQTWKGGTNTQIQHETKMQKSQILKQIPHQIEISFILSNNDILRALTYMAALKQQTGNLFL